MSDLLDGYKNEFLIIGANGQVGKDVQAYFTANGHPFNITQHKILCEQDVIECLNIYPYHKIINLAFDKSLRDIFTNIELPILLDNLSKRSPIYLSSNAVYGLNERCVSRYDRVNGFNAYARQKIEVEARLHNSTIIRGSFLSSQHRIFSVLNPNINKNSLWNGITALELARLIAKNSLIAGIHNVASMELLDWGDIASYFGKTFTHAPNLLENRCVLISDIPEINPIISQFKNLKIILPK